MKKQHLFKSMLLLCALVVGSNSLWADDDPNWSHEFASPEAISENAITVNGATWNVSTTVGTGSPTIDKGNANGKYCLKFGTGSKNYFSNITLTTNYFKNYNVKSVTVQVQHNAERSGTLTVTQGSTEIGSKTQTIGTTWTDLTVNTATGSGGNLSISYSPTSCAVNIHSITVVYTAGGSSDPSIDVTPTSKTENYDTEEGTFTVTLNKIDTGVGTEVVFYESDGTTPAVSNPYDWFDASINGDGNVAYTLTENTDLVNSRTAYFKVYGLAEESGDDVYSDLISLTQSKYTVDFATLPFEFDGDNSDVASTTGLTQSGLGKYDSSPKLKFDTTGDELILKIKGHLPQQLSFYIKGNSFSGGTFKVQWSINGIDYTDLASYTSITDGNKEIDLSSCVNLRYIKWVYTEKSGGNVALGNIAVSQQTVAITPTKEYTTLTHAKDLDFTGIEGLKAYIATEVTAGAVQMAQVNKVPAGTGLVLKKTSGSSFNVPVFDGTSPDDVSGNKMVGSATATTEIAANAGYILSNGVFQPASAGTLAAGKAYLAIAVSSAHPLEMNFEEGDVTAINKVEAAKQNAGVYYNLAGQRVAQPTKGLYIVNGKKVVLK